MNETTPTPPPASVPAKRARRSYDAPFKQSAVEHCRGHGGDVPRTAQELGVNPWTLRDWVTDAQRRATPPPPARSLAEAEAEVARLRGDLARITEQRDILKKSLGILSLT